MRVALKLARFNGWLSPVTSVASIILNETSDAMGLRPDRIIVVIDFIDTSHF